MRGEERRAPAVARSKGRGRGPPALSHAGRALEEREREPQVRTGGVTEALVFTSGGGAVLRLLGLWHLRTTLPIRPDPRPDADL